MLAIVLILHGLADHSRAIDRGAGGAASDTELFIRNLEDCLVALCAAPVSDVTRDTLEKVQRPSGSQEASKAKHRRFGKGILFLRAQCLRGCLVYVRCCR